MNRRQFLQTLGSIAKRQALEAPKQLAKIPKNTIANVREYDKLARDIKAKGNLAGSRRSFLAKATKKAGKIVIRNPREATYRVRQGAKVIGKAVKLPLTPLDGVVLQAEGRKLNRWQSLLSNFNRYCPYSYARF